MANQREPNLRIKSRPKIRQIYMCDFPPADCTWKPEFYMKNGPRPVAVISKSATYHGLVTIVPLSTKEQTEARNSLKIRSPIDGRDCWVVCNHLITVSTRRLAPPTTPIPRISDEQFQLILEKIHSNIPVPRVRQ